jgi:hypothetical protein
MVGVLQLLTSLFRCHQFRLHQDYRGNDLQAVGGAMLELLQQHVLFDHQRLLLAKQVFLFALQGASTGSLGMSH